MKFVGKTLKKFKGVFCSLRQERIRVNICPERFDFKIRNLICYIFKTTFANLKFRKFIIGFNLEVEI